MFSDSSMENKPNSIKEPLVKRSLVRKIIFNKVKDYFKKFNTVGFFYFQFIFSTVLLVLLLSFQCLNIVHRNKMTNF